MFYQKKKLLVTELNNNKINKYNKLGCGVIRLRKIFPSLSEDGFGASFFLFSLDIFTNYLKLCKNIVRVKSPKYKIFKS